MKKLMFIVVVLISAAMFAQTSSGGTSGVRIGSGNPSKEFNPEMHFQTSTSTIEISSDEVALTEVEIYDENYNLVGTSSVSTNNFSAHLGNLPSGTYFIYLESEDSEVRVETIFKP